MALIGELGAGKTLGLTYLALRNYHKGRTIYANYKLNLPYSQVNTVDDVEKMRDGFFAGDELWLWADSRLSGSKKNKFTTMVLAKSRKRGINIAYTVQYFKQVDVRIRTVTDFIVMPKLNDRETICRMFIYSHPSMQLQRVFKFRTAPIFTLYDTKQEIQSLDM